MGLVISKYRRWLPLFTRYDTKRKFICNQQLGFFVRNKTFHAIIKYILSMYFCVSLFHHQVVKVSPWVNQTLLKQRTTRQRFGNLLYEFPSQINEGASCHSLFPVGNIGCFVAQTCRFKQSHNHLGIVSICVARKTVMIHDYWNSCLRDLWNHTI